MIEYLYIGMVLISAMLIYFAIKQYKKTKDLLNNGIKTNAKVIDLIVVSDEDGYVYKPVFEYIDKANKMITFKSEIYSRPAPYNIGDNVDIMYSKNGDDRRVVSFWGLYRWPIILLLIASPLLIIGGGYLLYSKV